MAEPLNYATPAKKPEEPLIPQHVGRQWAMSIGAACLGFGVANSFEQAIVAACGGLLFGWALSVRD